MTRPTGRPKRVRRVHVSVRIDPSGTAFAAQTAEQESKRLGRRVTASDVYRMWMSMGIARWNDGERPKVT